MTAHKKIAIYAGSFDPWTFGHRYVLESALEIFDEIHIVSAINPAKKSALKPDQRAKLIAHDIDPTQNYWKHSLPISIGKRIVVTCQEGLIASYAEAQGISHLIRGLRSTTDFEAEFNLYFSNQAINSHLKTWAVMCPPRLLHCSSTYVKSVVGRQEVRFVGTSFLSQAFMLGWSPTMGQLFDLISQFSRKRFLKNASNLKYEDFQETMQMTFTNVYLKQTKISREAEQKTQAALQTLLKKEGKNQEDALLRYHDNFVHSLWALIALCLRENHMIPASALNATAYLSDLTKKLGNSNEELFSVENVIRSAAEI